MFFYIQFIFRPTEAKLIDCGIGFVPECFIVCFTRQYIHFSTRRTETLIPVFFFNFRFDDVLSSGSESSAFIFWHTYLPCSMFLRWYLFFLEAVSIFSPTCCCEYKLRCTNHLPQSFSNRLLILDCFSIPGGVFRLATSDWLPSVTSTSTRLSPAGLFCFAPRFPLSSDWLPLVPSTSSRPSPADLFCFVPRFPLSSGWHPLVPGTTILVKSNGTLGFFRQSHNRSQLLRFPSYRADIHQATRKNTYLDWLKAPISLAYIEL